MVQLLKSLMSRNPESPLFLPDGSVRAIIALTVVLGWFLFAVIGIMKGKLDIKILSDMPAIVAFIMGYYFAKGSGSNGNGNGSSPEINVNVGRQTKTSGNDHTENGA